jgi:hypothetical protein
MRLLLISSRPSSVFKWECLSNIKSKTINFCEFELFEDNREYVWMKYEKKKSFVQQKKFTIPF